MAPLDPQKVPLVLCVFYYSAHFRYGNIDDKGHWNGMVGELVRQVSIGMVGEIVRRVSTSVKAIITQKTTRKP